MAISVTTDWAKLGAYTWGKNFYISAILINTQCGKYAGMGFPVLPYLAISATGRLCIPPQSGLSLSSDVQCPRYLLLALSVHFHHQQAGLVPKQQSGWLVSEFF